MAAMRPIPVLMSTIVVLVAVCAGVQAAPLGPAGSVATYAPNADPGDRPARERKRRLEREAELFRSAGVQAQVVADFNEALLTDIAVRRARYYVTGELPGGRRSGRVSSLQSGTLGQSPPTKGGSAVPHILGLSPCVCTASYDDPRVRQIRQQSAIAPVSEDAGIDLIAAGLR